MYSINPQDHLQHVEKSKSDKSLNRLEKEHEMKVEDMKIENQIQFIIENIDINLNIILNKKNLKLKLKPSCLN